MTGALRGSLSVINTASCVAIPQTHLRQDGNVEDSLTFGKKDSQTRIVLRTI